MNETLILEIIFWFALFMVFYTYLGYGIVLYALVKLKELFVKPVKRVLPPDSVLPEVTLFITAFNEEDLVGEKMEDSLALAWPTRQWEPLLARHPGFALNTVQAIGVRLQEAHARLPHPCATPSQEQALLLAA